MLDIEAIAMWALIQLLSSLGFPKERVLIYAWHPLIVWEFAGSGHVDAVAIAFLALGLLARHRRAQGLVGITLACVTLIKLFPAVLFPGLYKRFGWKMPLAFALTVAVGYLPSLVSVRSRRLAFVFSKCLFPIDDVLGETQRFQEHCVGHLWLERVFSRH